MQHLAPGRSGEAAAAHGVPRKSRGQGVAAGRGRWGGCCRLFFLSAPLVLNTFPVPYFEKPQEAIMNTKTRATGVCGMMAWISFYANPFLASSRQRIQVR